MILVELEAAIDAAGTIKKFYMSTANFVTSPTDTPAHIAFDPALEDPGSIGFHVFSNGETTGDTQIEKGEMIVKNADGAFDAWVNYGFDGRPIVVRQGSGGAYPSSFPVVFVGTVEGVQTQGNKVIVSIRDKQRLFDEPALTNTYGGTNALPNGVDGTANDIKGKTKPKTFGKVFNVSPPQVNTSKLTFQVNDGAVASIDAYDRGVALTLSSDYATSTALNAATLTTGTYATCLAEGFFRLGGSPTGTVTADVVQGATAGVRTAAQLLTALALSAGLSGAEISAADATALDALNSTEVGCYIEKDDTFKDHMDAIASSIGAWYCFDGAGVMRMGRLSDPSTMTSALDIAEYDLIGRPERRYGRSSGLPAYRVVVNHTKIYTTQESDVAGSVTDARREFLKNEYRNEKAEDISVKTQFKLAQVLEVPTLLTSSSAASTEAARLLGLFKPRRDFFEVVVPSALAQSVGLRLGSCVTLFYNRFGLSGGKKFVTLGIRYELAGKVPKAVLTLWG